MYFWQTIIVRFGTPNLDFNGIKRGSIEIKNAQKQTTILYLFTEKHTICSQNYECTMS